MKKTTKKKVKGAARPKKTAPRRAAAKPAGKKPAVAPAGPGRPASYTPQAIQGIGWAPFRYPPR